MRLVHNSGSDPEYGDILANDSDNYSVSLLAPRAGIVRLNAVEKYIVLEYTARFTENADIAEKEMLNIEWEMGAAGINRYKLMSLGAW